MPTARRQKKKNPNDATFRNINALKKRVNAQEQAIRAISQATCGLITRLYVTRKLNVGK